MQRTPTSRRGFLRTLAAAGAASPLLARAERLEAALSSAAEGAPFRADDGDAASRLRAQYLLSDDLVYLNHASIGTVPEAVHRAHVGYLELCEHHPSLYVWGSVWRDVTEETRAAGADLLSCRPDDLAITHNTTEGINILAHGLPIGDGDEVLFSSLNHPGASVAWRGLADRRGYTVRSFDFPLERVPQLSVEEVVQLHVDALAPETRVLVIPHVDNMVGMTHPLAEISRAVRSRGVEFVVVDGAQSAGMIPVDLSAAGVDAYAVSPHKWIQSPKGLGMFWVSPEVREVLPRMWFRTPGERIEESARKYEDYSTRAWPAVVALGDALAFQAAIGEQEKARRYAALWRRVHERTADGAGLRWRSPVAPELRSVIMAVEADGRQAAAMAPELLASVGAVVRAFGPPLNTFRVSPNVMTTDEEVDRFLEALSPA